jgi:hypothetical protein
VPAFEACLAPFSSIAAISWKRLGRWSALGTKLGVFLIGITWASFAMAEEVRCSRSVLATNLPWDFDIGRLLTYTLLPNSNVLDQSVADQSAAAASEITRAGRDAAFVVDAILDEVCEKARASSAGFRSVLLLTEAVAKWAASVSEQSPSVQTPLAYTATKGELAGSSTGAFSSIADKDAGCPTPDSSIRVRYRAIGAAGSLIVPNFDLLINHVRMFCRRTRSGISLTIFVSFIASRTSSQSEATIPAKITAVIAVERPDGSMIDTRSEITVLPFPPARQFTYSLLKANFGFPLIGRNRAEDFRVRVVLD